MLPNSRGQLAPFFERISISGQLVEVYASQAKILEGRTKSSLGEHIIVQIFPNASTLVCLYAALSRGGLKSRILLPRFSPNDDFGRLNQHFISKPHSELLVRPSKIVVWDG